jgi:hypothetical protein
MLREPSPATCRKSKMAVSSPAQVFPRCITRTSYLVLRDNVRLPIVVRWRATKTTSVSVPARSAIAVAGKKPGAGSARHGDARPVSSVRSIGRSGAPAAIRTGIPEPGREAAGSTRGAGRCNGVGPQGSERVEPGRERGAHAGATGGGEGPCGEAQPAARSRPWTAVCQRQGSGRAPALPRTGRRDKGW